MNARGALGKYGENLAVRRLTESGMNVLARNWRAGRAGEIDIVALDRDALVICEVKTRRVRRTPAPGREGPVAGPVGPYGSGGTPADRWEAGRGVGTAAGATAPAGDGALAGDAGDAGVAAPGIGAPAVEPVNARHHSSGAAYVFQHPTAGLTADQLDRLRGLAECWLHRHGGPPAGGVRIDLIGVTLPSRGAPVIEHVRGVA